MKKSSKLFLIILIVIFSGIALFIVNGIYGNPISKKIAEKSAENYITKQYEGEHLKVEAVFYNFKDGNYQASVVSETSIDTYFTVYIAGNKVLDDSYENDVVSGWNTYERIDKTYRDLVEQVFAADEFPLVSEIDFGSIELYEKSFDPVLYDEADYGIGLHELELDKEYDVKEIAKTAGHITYYAQDEEISFQKASESVLMIKEKLDEADIPFYALDFVLEKPRDQDNAIVDDSEGIHIANFLSDDIYEEGLKERIEQAHDELMDYYEREDTKFKD